MDRIQRLFQAQAAAGGAGPAAPDAPVVDTGELVYISSSTHARIEPARAAPHCPLTVGGLGSDRPAPRTPQWRCSRCSSTGGRACRWR